MALVVDHASLLQCGWAPLAKRRQMVLERRVNDVLPKEAARRDQMEVDLRQRLDGGAQARSAYAMTERKKKIVKARHAEDLLHRVVRQCERLDDDSIGAVLASTMEPIDSRLESLQVLQSFLGREREGGARSPESVRSGSPNTARVSSRATGKSSSRAASRTKVSAMSGAFTARTGGQHYGTKTTTTGDESGGQQGTPPTTFINDMVRRVADPALPAPSSSDTTPRPPYVPTHRGDVSRVLRAAAKRQATRRGDAPSSGDAKADAAPESSGGPYDFLNRRPDAFHHATPLEGAAAQVRPPMELGTHSRSLHGSHAPTALKLPQLPAVRLGSVAVKLPPEAEGMRSNEDSGEGGSSTQHLSRSGIPPLRPRFSMTMPAPNGFFESPTRNLQILSIGDPTSPPKEDSPILRIQGSRGGERPPAPPVAGGGASQGNTPRNINDATRDRPPVSRPPRAAPAALALAPAGSSSADGGSVATPWGVAA